MHVVSNINHKITHVSREILWCHVGYYDTTWVATRDDVTLPAGVYNDTCPQQDITW